MTPLFKLLACAALGVQLFLGCFGAGGGTLCLEAWACSDQGRACVPAEGRCCCCQDDERGQPLATNAPAEGCGCCIQVPPVPGGTGLVDTRASAGDELRLFLGAALSALPAIVAPFVPPPEDVWLPPALSAARVHVSISTTHMMI